MKQILNNQKYSVTCYIMNHVLPPMLEVFELEKKISKTIGKKDSVCDLNFKDILTIAKNKLDIDIYDFFEKVLKRRIKNEVKTVFITRKFLKLKSNDSKIMFLHSLGVSLEDSASTNSTINRILADSKKDKYAENTILRIIHFTLSTVKDNNET